MTVKDLRPSDAPSVGSAVDDILQNTTLSQPKQHAQLLLLRSELTDSIAENGLQPSVVLERAKTYKCLGYSDLAAADAYLALTLAETGLDPDHSDLEPVCILDGEVVSWPPDDDTEAAWDLKAASMKLLIDCLLDLNCLQDAYYFSIQLKKTLDHRGYAFATQVHQEIGIAIWKRFNKSNKLKLGSVEGYHGDLANVKLPNSGFARREVYPWNEHEPDRSSSAALDELNARLRAAAPALEVRSTTLPVLHDSHLEPYLPANGYNGRELDDHDPTNPNSKHDAEPATSVQLGLFATRPLPPGSAILHENSTVTATRTLHASLCDNCSSSLPSLSSANPPISCNSCTEAVFCSQQCHDLAQSLYHPLLCDNEDGIEEIGRDPTSSTPAEDLHFLLVTRALSMAEHQGVHPLNLPEIKYLWGDFVPVSDRRRLLPFTFQHSIVLPFRFLTTLDISSSLSSSYLCHDAYAPWVIATLYSKCRGVASARQSTWDGRPEVAAVHPLWCLANHSCNPNVEWSWGGEQNKLDGAHDDSGAPEETKTKEGKGGQIVYRVRDKRVWERPVETRNETTERKINDTKGEQWLGIKEGEEILNHYCDVRLPVQERREWASGPLGGDCMCERCFWEAHMEYNA